MKWQILHDTDKQGKQVTEKAYYCPETKHYMQSVNYPYRLQGYESDREDNASYY